MAKRATEPVQFRVRDSPFSHLKAKTGPIHAISLAGFKSHKKTLDIELKPITLLAGGNSSGKSSLMQPLLLMKQTIETFYEPPPLFLGGPLVTVDKAEDLFWQGEDGVRVEVWSIKLRYGAYSSRIKYLLESSEIGGLAFGDAMVKARDEEGAAIFWADMEDEELKESALQYARMDPDGGMAFDSYNLGIGHVQARCAYDLGIGNDLNDGIIEDYQTVVPTLPRDDISSIIHLPGLRDSPERSYAVTGVSGRFPGRFPEYTASLLHHWQKKQDDRLQGVVDDLRTLELADQLDAPKLNDRRVEIRVSRRIGGSVGDMVNIADVGVGVSQVLPIVVALRAAGKDQIVHIEQPELHLHPRAEIALADLFVAAARRGARLVLETHSSTLLRAFQAAVAVDDSGWVQQNLALHWFARDASGESKVTTAEVQADGTFGDWPVDLSVVEMDMARRLLTASHARRAKAAKGAS